MLFRHMHHRPTDAIVNQINKITVIEMLGGRVDLTWVVVVRNDINLLNLNEHIALSNGAEWRQRIHVDTQGLVWFIPFGGLPVLLLLFQPIVLYFTSNNFLLPISKKEGISYSG